MYGSGTPLRQFVHSYDIAEIIIKILNEYKDTKPIICCNDEISIKDLTYLVGKLSDFDLNKITSDSSKSDGCLRKSVDGTYFKEVFPDFKYMSLEEGIKQTIEWFNKNYNNCRK